MKRKKTKGPLGSSADALGFLTGRMKCGQRTGVSKEPVEQAVRSCLHAYYIANNWALRQRNGLDAITGANFREALAPCRKCPVGAEYLKHFEKNFGKLKLDSNNMIYRAQMKRRHAWLEGKNEPRTAIHQSALEGHSTC